MLFAFLIFLLLQEFAGEFSLKRNTGECMTQKIVQISGDAFALGNHCQLPDFEKTLLFLCFCTLPKLFDRTDKSHGNNTGRSWEGEIGKRVFKIKLQRKDD